MGCVSSKLFPKDRKHEFLLVNGCSPNHVVSLKSSTYGVLKIDSDQPIKDTAIVGSKGTPPSDAPEIINAWDLMKGLEDEMPISLQTRKSPKSRPFFLGFHDVERSPLRFLNRTSSPKRIKGLSGKENNPVGRLDYSPKGVLKACNSLEKSRKKSPGPGTRYSKMGSPINLGRRSWSPLFDPELIKSFEKDLSEEGEQIKTMVSSAPKTQKPQIPQDCKSILNLFEENCPPGGENSVVIYTTTLRGIRKTFEDCNEVRTIIESNCIRMFERDISMDSGFKEELRRLMGKKGVKVPLVFVKGRLIGGAEEMVRLEEEGKLGMLFEGIPRSVIGCEGCLGVRFAMCMDCNGSCKVLDADQKTMRCGECNENGLIRCPMCC